MRRGLVIALLAILLCVQQTVTALVGRRIPMASSSSLTIKSRDPVSNMPWLGLGTWRSEKGKVKEAVTEAIRIGYSHIDAAQVYENQHEVGEGIQEAIAKGYITKPDDVWVTSKIWNTDHRREHVRPAALRILRELSIPKIQQLLIHWPTSTKKVDDATLWPKDAEGKHLYDDVDYKDTWQEMEKLVEEGLVETIGLSNFNEKEVEDILSIAKIKPVCNQVEAHPYLPQDTLKSFLAEKNMALVAYSPLGNLDPNDPSKPSPLRDEAILSAAKKHGKTPAQVIIRWHLQKGHVVIPKTVTLPRLAENADVFGWGLDADDMAAIAEAGQRNKVRMVNPGFRHGQPVFVDQ